MMLDLIAWLVAIILAGTMGLVIRGFLYIALTRDGTAVYHLGRGVVMILIALAMRAGYWDGLPMLFDWIGGSGTWAAWLTFTGKPLPNIITGLIAIAGTRHMLKVQWLLIPETDRQKYSIWSAPFYPRRVMISRGLAMMRRRWRERRRVNGGTK